MAEFQKELQGVKQVASLIIPGDEDPEKYLRNNNFTMDWGGKTVRRFKEVKIEHVLPKPDEEKDKMTLPVLYLHFLPPEFRVEKDGNESLDQSLRSGNDASEVVIKLPSNYLSPEFAAACRDFKDKIEIVQAALKDVGEVFVHKTQKERAESMPSMRFYSLKAARAKADVNLDKKAFGIPERADQYLFVNNHSSVIHFDLTVKDAFNDCIQQLAGSDDETTTAEQKKFAVFLKVFYEGGFAYNYKKPVGETAFLPLNVGTAAMSVVPSFEGQIGISTGYPYKLPAPFLQFTETVPISIDPIREMSDRHGRYGLCFTRLVYVWAGENFETDNELNFASILPHGGFFYVPDKLEDHRRLGGLVYAFGEKAEEALTELSRG